MLIWKRIHILVFIAAVFTVIKILKKSKCLSWRRKWQPTPVFLPGKSHGQGSLAGYSPWGHKEPDMTERLHLWSVYQQIIKDVRDLCIYVSYLCVCIQLTQSCLTLYNPMDCRLPGTSVLGIFQATILEWVATSYTRGSFQPKHWILISCISCVGRQILYYWATREAYHIYIKWSIIQL